MQPERRRRVWEDIMIAFLRVVTCTLLLVAADGARAQTAPAQPLPMQAWPTRPIKLIVATGPGLATDIMARLLADGVSRALGQQVFVENVAGASGILGAQAARVPLPTDIRCSSPMLRGSPRTCSC
jgi:tripartite-type tricarboxylate transporter receptor subunit TctC